MAPPNNYDGLTYRLPRTMHWLAAGQWHWINTPEARMNFSGIGFEWLQTALFSLTQSDRGLFLLNLIPFLMLPGLIFRVFRRLGVVGRVARFWMWFLPLTYGIALQAGSIGNDALACFYVLAAMGFALAAGQSGRMFDLCLAILAAAFLTSVKASNLPLLLPIMLTFWPARQLIRRHAGQLAIMGLVALGVSFLPIAVANQVYAGHWTGDADNLQGVRLKHPIAGFIGNTTMLLAQSITPPALPPARKATALVNDHLPALFDHGMQGEYPRFAIVLTELPQEESSGVGLGCTLLLLIVIGRSVLKIASVREWLRSATGAQQLGLWVGSGALIALLFYLAKLGSEYPARLLTPYYPVLIMLCALSPAANYLVRSRWWRGIALMSAASTLGVLLITPARPVLPMEHWINTARKLNPEGALLHRASDVYSTYRTRHDMLGSLRQYLPDSVTRIGLSGGGDESEMSLWRPYGHRQVERISPEELLSKDWHGLEWVVVKANGLPKNQDDWAEMLTADLGATIVAREQITTKLARGPEEWLVLRLPISRASPASL